jgi:hypothetical protein
MVAGTAPIRPANRLVCRVDRSADDAPGAVAIGPVAVAACGCCPPWSPAPGDRLSSCSCDRGPSMTPHSHRAAARRTQLRRYHYRSPARPYWQCHTRNDLITCPTPHTLVTCCLVSACPPCHWLLICGRRCCERLDPLAAPARSRRLFLDTALAAGLPPSVPPGFRSPPVRLLRPASAARGREAAALRAAAVLKSGLRRRPLRLSHALRGASKIRWSFTDAAKCQCADLV